MVFGIQGKRNLQGMRINPHNQGFGGFWGLAVMLLRNLVADLTLGLLKKALESHTYCPSRLLHHD